MAEILISLTIIGIIAAITLPSLRANINEKTWATQRKALYSRMSQAIAMLPAINAYGEYAGTWNNNTVTVTKDTAAITFVTDGLNKVLKITDICDNQHFKDCGLPDKYTKFQENGKTDFPKKISDLSPYFVQTVEGYEAYVNPQKNIDTAAVAFETANGESVAVFYNPYCVSRDIEFSQSGDVENWVDAKNIYPYFCATFLYDLNGRKGPNVMGKDMWFITALYSSDTSVVTIPLEKLTKHISPINYYGAVTYCSSQNARLVNVNEGIAAKMANLNFGWLSGDTNYSNRAYGITNSGSLIKYNKDIISSLGVRCIKR